jgi:hypothetical protein
MYLGGAWFEYEWDPNLTEISISLPQDFQPNPRIQYIMTQQFIPSLYYLSY